ncbi:MAG TPA: glycosyltransferase family 1 protein, partial [Candidatus Desulfofervidus auxilii]|nr:glycosyltransferase family 1 protein [Candidatus Desulfofervidus auxilii]
KLGIHNQIKWFDYKTDDALLEEFQRSMFMVTPYTTSEAGAAVTTAMANAVPVIATRNVGLPEYLGDDGIYINENDPKYLADKMAQLINNNALRQTLSIRLYNRAVKFYSWEVIAQKTLELYKKVLS